MTPAPQAVGINPSDNLLQSTQLMPHLTYPNIIGSDIAGEVVEVGPGVNPQRFKPGDRVLGLTIGGVTNAPTQGAFQQYSIVYDNFAARIPDALSYAEAAVIPLGLATAAAGLFQTDHLNLTHPSTSPKPVGSSGTLLVWSGASSVGSNAIQLAVAAGYEVIATASPSSFSHCKDLGAAEVFDYNDPDIIEKAVAALQGKTVRGAFVAAGFQDAPYHIIDKLGSGGRKNVSTATLIPDSKPEGVEAQRVYFLTIKENQVSKIVFGKFLEEALRSRNFKAEPKPLVVGEGLEAVQGGLDRLKEGVSARKVVVRL